MLPLLPPLALWIATGFTRASVRRTIVALVVIASFNAAQFAVANPWTAEQTGGGLVRADCTVLAREHDVQWTRDALDLRSDRDGRLLQVRPQP